VNTYFSGGVKLVDQPLGVDLAQAVAVHTAPFRGTETVKGMGKLR
jgi:hypothetical protein